MPRTARVAPGGMVFHVLNRAVGRMQQSLLADWPTRRQSNWLEWVNQAETEKKLESLHKSVQRGRPFGGPVWHKQIAKRLGLESAYRPIGRPPKAA
jgi:putative transposase